MARRAGPAFRAAGRRGCFITKAPERDTTASSGKAWENSTRLPIGRVLEALLLHLVVIFPHDDASARIRQPERVEYIVAGAAGGARGHAIELAGEEIIGAAKL